MLMPHSAEHITTGRPRSVAAVTAASKRLAALAIPVRATLFGRALNGSNLQPNPLDMAGLELVRQFSAHITDLHSLRSEYKRTLNEVDAAYLHTLDLILRIAEFKDSDTGTHIVRMGAISALLAFALGQPEDWCDLLEKAAPMHDVGKIGIPDAILKKASSLDSDEWRVMRTHPSVGAEILRMHDTPVFKLAAEVAQNHHEKWDGSGYPCGVEGESIPLSGRIVAVADYIDALTMDRAYRKALKDDTAFSMLEGQSGVSFDPQIVSCAMRIRPHIVRCRDAINDLYAKAEQITPQRGLWKKFAPPEEFIPVAPPHAEDGRNGRQ